MAEPVDLEMREINRLEFDEPGFKETPIDFPDVPLEHQPTEQLGNELKIEQFVDSTRRILKLTKPLDNDIYKKLTIDKDGYLSYSNKRVSSKNRKSLLSFNTINRSTSGREFLHKLGYDIDVRVPVDSGSDIKSQTTANRDLETVSPEQVESIKEKIRSFKVSEDWARQEKEKSLKQLSEATTEHERKTLKESVTHFEQLELQAKKRYNEILQNQFKRINEIINDKTRSLSERLKELFRRDGLTIGAIITALGMTISTIVLSILPLSPSSSPSSNPKPSNSIHRVLLKLSNWLLDLAKKSMSALLGIFGSLISFLFKKAGEAVLFLSEHLIILFLALILFISEFIFSKIRNRHRTQEH